ncbi:hypothetical protein [Pontibacter burrus]|uniref:Phage portal protein n=1 Tax=Pontibacter burrus TaxID=2704466 RepID=A0A6B3LGF4_9BACT|nr:hypothetical protein [Pontibacter burrus]NEM96152.1 hypothetical protein [Pontibacter burrus]
MKGKRIKAKVVKARAGAQASAQPAASGKPQEKGTAKVIDYGKDNKLPQEIMQAFLASPTARRCWRRLKKFIQADGFADRTAAAMRVNPEQTADDLLPLLSWDTAPGFGFALRIKYTLDGSNREAYYVPFQTVRKLDDGRFLVNPNLGTIAYKAEDDEILDAFDDSPEGIARSLAQEDKEGDPQPGQILYVYEENGAHPYYPEPDAWAAKEDILSDKEIQRADYNAIRKRVKPNAAMAFPYEIDDTTADEDGKTDWDHVEEQVRHLTDEDGEGDMVVFDGLDGNVPQIISMDAMKPTLSMDQKSESIRKRICIAFGVHPALIGLDTAGQLGNTQQLLNLIQLMQQDVLDAQGAIQRTFKRLWPAFDWTLTSLNLIKAMPEQAWQALTEEERRDFLGRPKLDTEQTSEGQKTLNALNSLSPLVANKVLESMTTNQILALVGLPEVEGGDQTTAKKEETEQATALAKLKKWAAKLKV